MGFGFGLLVSFGFGLLMSFGLRLLWQILLHYDDWVQLAVPYLKGFHDDGVVFF